MMRRGDTSLETGKFPLSLFPRATSQVAMLAWIYGGYVTSENPQDFEMTLNSYDKLKMQKRLSSGEH